MAGWLAGWHTYIHTLTLIPYECCMCMYVRVCDFAVCVGMTHTHTDCKVTYTHIHTHTTLIRYECQCMYVCMPASQPTSHEPDSRPALLALCWFIVPDCVFSLCHQRVCGLCLCGRCVVSKMI